MSKIPWPRSRCQQQVSPPQMVSMFRRCKRWAIKDGWCLQHHPVTVAKREALKRERFQAKMAVMYWEQDQPQKLMRLIRAIHLEADRLFAYSTRATAPSTKRFLRQSVKRLRLILACTSAQ